MPGASALRMGGFGRFRADARAGDDDKILFRRASCRDAIAQACPIPPLSRYFGSAARLVLHRRRAQCLIITFISGRFSAITYDDGCY